MMQEASDQTVKAALAIQHWRSAVGHLPRHSALQDGDGSLARRSCR